MLGAIAGDVIGSVFEGRQRHIKTTQFPLFGPYSKFTDDTVLTVAVAEAILRQRDYGNTLKTYGRAYPHAGYGSAFRAWIFQDEVIPYGSFGNGSAMRVSPVGWAFDDVNTVLQEAKRTAEVTHNHPEGIKGAQATALAVFLARQGADKHTIKTELVARFGYNLDRPLAEIRRTYHFDVTCQGSVPESIIAFLEAVDYESAIRNAISLGGDSDTQACIAGGIAHAFYKTIPAEIVRGVRACLPTELESRVDEFLRVYAIPV